MIVPLLVMGPIDAPDERDEAERLGAAAELEQAKELAETQRQRADEQADGRRQAPQRLAAPSQRRDTSR